MLLNGVSLCMGHHMWAHRQVLDFHDWMRDELGEAQYDELRCQTLPQTVAWLSQRNAASAMTTSASSTRWATPGASSPSSSTSPPTDRPDRESEVIAADTASR